MCERLMKIYNNELDIEKFRIFYKKMIFWVKAHMRIIDIKIVSLKLNYLLDLECKIF